MDSATVHAILQRLALVLRLDPASLLEDVPSALRQELVCRANAQGASISAVAMDHGSHHAAAVECDYRRHELELIVAQRRGQRTDWRLASTPERVDNSPLGFEGLCGDVVRDRLDHPLHLVVARADFDRDNSLAGRRHAGAERQRERDSPGKAKTMETG